MDATAGSMAAGTCALEDEATGDEEQREQEEWNRAQHRQAHPQ